MLLVGVGIATIYSTTLGTEQSYFAWQQGVFAFIGLVLMFVFSFTTIVIYVMFHGFLCALHSATFGGPFVGKKYLGRQDGLILVFSNFSPRSS